MKNAFEDAINRLELEYEGFRKLVLRYTDEAPITNYFSKLKIAMDEKNLNNLKYCLYEIEKWYRKNISEIQRIDEYGYQTHLEAMNKIIELNGSIQIIPDDYYLRKRTVVKQNQVIENHNKHIIFISHSSSDKKYGNALRKFIIGLGVKDEQLIYTSHELNGIPMDKNIYEYLRENFDNKVFMIILWSNTYLESPACLNEMGAAWVTQSDYTNVYVPDFEFGNPKYHQCAVDTRKMGAVLKNDGHCKTKMLELKDKILKMFNLEIDEKHFMVLLDEFLKDIE